MEFRREDFTAGGKVLVPHSQINDYTFGEIIEVSSAGIHVVYFKDTIHQQKGFYSFSYLRHRYGKPTIKLLPPSKDVSGTVPSKNRFEDEEFTPDDLPWVP